LNDIAKKKRQAIRGDGCSRLGRRSKLTDDLGSQILRVLALGATHRTACRSVGIAKSTFYAWLLKGERSDSTLFQDFLDAVRQVEAQRELEALATICQAAARDWRAAAWYLGRRYPERWGNKRGIVGEHTAPSVQSTMPISKEAVALAQALERISLALQQEGVSSNAFSNERKSAKDRIEENARIEKKRVVMVGS
jgi:hypothetical protein